MPYAIVVKPLAKAELDALRVFDQRRIVQEMRAQLTDTPAVATRRRKNLGIIDRVDFDYEPPLWELKVGEHRVFYDVDSELHEVNVRTIRQKRPEQTTQEVLGGEE